MEKRCFSGSLRDKRVDQGEEEGGQRDAWCERAVAIRCSKTVCLRLSTMGRGDVSDRGGFDENQWVEQLLFHLSASGQF